MATDKDVQFQLNLFQGWRLRDDGIEIQFDRLQQQIIAALAIYGALSCQSLGALLWGPAAEAARHLRITAFMMARQIPDLLVFEGRSVSLADTVSVDLNHFLVKVAKCEQSNCVSTADGCLSQLLRVELLPDWNEDWVVLEQHKLHVVRLRSLLIHARRWLTCGEGEMAVKAAGASLELEPLHESGVELLMRAELQTGRPDKAVKTFEGFKTRLASELKLAPSEYLVRLAEAIRG